MTARSRLSCTRARRLGHAADRAAAHRPSRRRARQLGAAAGAVRLLLFRRRLARADERLRRHESAHVVRLRQRRRLDRRGPRSRRRAPSSSSRSCPEHAELYLLLSMVVPVPWLERVPTYKEQQETLKDKDLSSIGFLGYPLLQTADVAIYDARFVPVGEDQVAHLELAREVVRRFNNVFGGGRRAGRAAAAADDVCAAAGARRRQEDEQEPRQHDSSVRQRRRGEEEGDADVHGSRSASAPTSRARSRGIRSSRITTRSTRTRDEVEDLKARYRAGKVGDVEVKTKLANALNAHLDPIPRAARRGAGAAGSAERDSVRRIEARARGRRRDDGQRVRDAVKITYR